jgi:hypothetical protein
MSGVQMLVEARHIQQDVVVKMVINFIFLADITLYINQNFAFNSTAKYNNPHSIHLNMT